jgi:hypothetical protein
MIYRIWAVSVEFHFVETPYCSEFKYVLERKCVFVSKKVKNGRKRGEWRLRRR